MELWHGIATALAIVLAFGAAFAWIAKRDRSNVLDAIPGLVAILTPAGEVDVVNNELIEYCGQPVEAMRQWGKNGTIHAEDLPAVANVFMKAIAAGEPYEFEARVRRFDGAYRWNQVRGLPFRDARRRILRWYVLLSDIDARKRAEEARRFSEERYALAVAGSDDGVWDIDFVAKSVFVSKRARELAGMTEGAEVTSLEEWSAALPIHPEDVPRRTAAIEAHLAGQAAAYEGEFRLRQLDGIYRWRRLHGLCLHGADGVPRRMAGSISDVDARRRVEDALRLSEARYALALEAAEEGHFDSDLETGDTFASARVHEIYGLPPVPRFLNRHEFQNQIPIHPDDRDRVVAEMNTQGRSDPTVDLYELEFRIVPRPGETRWIHSRAKLVRDAEGRPRRRVGVVSDITERKRAEEALREQTERLELGQAAMHMIIMDWNLTKDRLTWSDSAEWLRGPVPESGCYPPFEDQVHPDDREGFLAARRRALETLQVETSDFRLIRTDGEVIWVLERKNAFAGADGKAVRMLAAMVDITDRKRIEEALRESDQRHERAMLAAEAGFWDWNIPADEFYASPKLLEISHLPMGTRFTGRADFMARTPLIVPEDLRKWEQAVKDLFAGEGSLLAMDLRSNHGGEMRWHLLSGMCVRDSTGRVQRWTGSATDITDRKRAEEALRESDQRYERVMLAAEAGFWDWNVPADKFYASPRLLEMTDVPAGTPLAGRADFMDHVTFHPEDRKKWDHAVQELFSSGGTRLAMEMRSIHGGETRWALLSGMCLRDAAGQIVRWTGSATDITDRKRATNELRESEARFRGLTALWSDWYWRQDEHLRFTFSSAALNAPDGYPGDSPIGKTRWELPGVVPLSSTWDEHRELLAAHKPFRDFEFFRPAADGTLRYISASGAPIFDEDGEFRGYHGVGRDVTERKHAEQELRSRQEMLDLAQKSAQAIAFEWKMDDGQGKDRWSSELEAMYGLAPGTSDGSYEKWKRLVHPEDRPAVNEALAHAHGTGDVAVEYRVRHPDHSLHWLQAKGRMFFDAAGKPTRIVGFMQDVTQRRRAEDDMRELETRLRQAQRLESMGTLAGGIAHDFNNILGAIIGYGEMALRGAKKDTRLRRDLDAIMSAGERGRALVDRILAFSRSGVGERVSVHVESVVSEAVDQLAARLPHGISVKGRLRAGRAAMLGDSTQVHQVVMNLISNAAQAMPHGGVLRVELGTTHVDAARPATVGSIVIGDYIVLTVSDTGTGIPADVLERMFDPFFTTKEVGVGTGLGLSLVHGIVTFVGGAIDVATEPGKGSTFTVHLPRSGEADERSMDEDLPLPRGEGQRVLLVDDEETLVRLASEMLEALGYAPTAFTSSTRALEAFDANPNAFDAILTDERMPGVTGSVLIREVRRISPSIPIVLMSGFVGAAAAATVRELGANDVLRKPLLSRDLATSLARVLHA